MKRRLIVELLRKKIFKFQAVMPRITQTEKALLAKYDFNTLEYTTVKQMYEELALLQKWSVSADEKLKKVVNDLKEKEFDVNEFKEKLKKVTIYRIALPENTNLNRYFDILSLHK